MNIQRNIPNVITLMNLLSGILAILFILRDELVLGSLCITIALVLDFLDGFLARLLHAQSPIGEQLDSLSDLVSFGVAPGYILWSLMRSGGSFHFRPSPLCLLSCPGLFCPPPGQIYD